MIFPRSAKICVKTLPHHDVDYAQILTTRPVYYYENVLAQHFRNVEVAL
jgi:hypothetical protein